MKSTDQIFPGRKIHPSFAADTAVDLREQRRRNLNEANAAHPHGGGKPRHVAHNATPQRHHDALSIQSHV